ncbi:acetyltransferase (GNAT) family protein [Aquimarina sp. MAR_2010_214]|uniref:GNAT family N-acetyltransferase n=1 Tax=Aquimarina sp. MAR_2010_214 TaxID=1250026 RepID=UPI000C70F503|nr:GNAT family N-acetyltransferase [Aquimarina sp. MAR_2010_214]PKV52796.1 acetyltransferase (GNAT) family protein [Aquimarina sp. MAR_2010_214]
MITEIKQITPSETLPIRQKVMWPNKPIEYVELSNDENGRHFGLFVNEEVTSIISVFVENNEAQFRKFATLVEFQGLGYGTILLKRIIDLMKKEGIKKLWCNARVEKSKFYERFDLKLTDEKFKKGGIEYVIMERTFVNMASDKT